MKYNILLVTSFLIVSCDNKIVTNQGNTPIIQNLSESDSFPIIDTTVLLKGIIKSNYNGKNLTDSIAKGVLYTYFKIKGYYNSDSLPDAEKVKDSDLCVDFSKIYLTELNTSNNHDAVITYWLTLPYASGHCWQTHKAIILDTDNGYKILNEDFIPDNFIIDSVLTNENNVTIYGYDYDCGSQKALRNFIVKIKC